jgi:predicted DNA-binding antitoxin AbrB/MazE fold protein
MSQTVPAVFENGVLRPLGEVSLRPNQRVLLHIEDAPGPAAELEDPEFLAYCHLEGDPTVTLDAVRQALAKIPGTLTQACTEERDED